jgi:hypothetical protein
MILSDFIAGLKVIESLPSGAILATIEAPSPGTVLTLAEDVLPLLGPAGVVIPYVGEIEIAIAVLQFLAANSVPDPNPISDAQTAASGETDGKYVGR